mmetsp:Transcript_33839/g.97278  ORF Transcript_33839/g.97278 Transcript_33839/m.97278 type:complete len:203 (+) Transcript_33839:1173-1781(+)
MRRQSTKFAVPAALATVRMRRPTTLLRVSSSSSSAACGRRSTTAGRRCGGAAASGVAGLAIAADVCALRLLCGVATLRKRCSTARKRREAVSPSALRTASMAAASPPAAEPKRRLTALLVASERRLSHDSKAAKASSMTPGARGAPACRQHATADATQAPRASASRCGVAVGANASKALRWRSNSAAASKGARPAASRSRHV